MYAGVSTVNPNDALWPNQWSLRRIGAPTGWTTTVDAKAVTVCVTDTGIDYTCAPVMCSVLHPAEVRFMFVSCTLRFALAVCLDAPLTGDPLACGRVPGYGK